MASLDGTAGPGPGGRPGPAAPSAATLLEVAESLRWSDPDLSAALAERAARLAEDDASGLPVDGHPMGPPLDELDRGAVTIARAVPELLAAVRDGRRDEAAALRCELGAAALLCGDPEIADRVLDSVGDLDALPSGVRAEVHLRTAESRAARGDVAGTDDAVGLAEAALSGSAPSVATRTAIDLQRARADARVVAGDPRAAIDVLGDLDRRVDPDLDAGRRATQVAQELVVALLDTGDAVAARERAVRALSVSPTAATAVAAGRLRIVTAARIHLPAGEWAEAERLVGAAAADLTERGHLADASLAVEIAAAAAEARGELGRALEAVRHAHDLALRARDEQHGALRALVDGLHRVAASSGAAPAEAPVPVVTDDVSDRAAQAAPSGSPTGLPWTDGPVTAGDRSDADGWTSRDLIGARAEGRSDHDGVGRRRSPADVDPSSVLVATTGTTGTTGTTEDGYGSTGATAGPRSGGHRSDPGRTDPPDGDGSGSTPTAADPLAVSTGEGDVDARPDGESVAAPPTRRSRRRRAEDTGDGSPTVDPWSLAGGAPADGTARPERHRRAHPSTDAFSTAPARPSSEDAPREPASGASTNGHHSLSRHDGGGSAPDLAPDRSTTSWWAAGDDGRAGGGAPTDGRDPTDGGRSTAAPEGGSNGLFASAGGLADDLPLTLAGLLAEYDGPDRAGLPSTAGGGARRPRGGASPGAAASGLDGSAPRTDGGPDPRVGPGERPGAGATGQDGDTGARLADLLAEAMDAFRRNAPESGEGRPTTPSR